MADTQQTSAGLITVDQAAALLMKSKERIRQLAVAGFIPKVGRDKYPLVGVVQGYLRFRDEAEQKKTQSAAESGLKATRQAEIQMRIDERRQQFVKRADVDEALGVLIGVLREEFDGFAARVSAEPSIQAEVDLALNEAFGIIDGVSVKAKEMLAKDRPSLGPLRCISDLS